MSLPDFVPPAFAVPMELETLQKPLPPIWYGAHSPESAERAARRGLNIVNNDGLPVAVPTLERFREVWRELHGAAPLPLTGLVRFIVVAETDDEALSIARRAYPRWFDSFTLLWRKHGQTPTLGADSIYSDKPLDLALQLVFRYFW